MQGRTLIRPDNSTGSLSSIRVSSRTTRFYGDPTAAIPRSRSIHSGVKHPGRETMDFQTVPRARIRTCCFALSAGTATRCDVPTRISPPLSPSRNKDNTNLRRQLLQVAIKVATTVAFTVHRNHTYKLYDKANCNPAVAKPNLEKSNHVSSHCRRHFTGVLLVIEGPVRSPSGETAFKLLVYRS